MMLKPMLPSLRLATRLSPPSTLCLLRYFFMIFCRLLIIFFQSQLFGKTLSGIPSVVNILDPDQVRHFVCKGYQRTALEGKGAPLTIERSFQSNRGPDKQKFQLKFVNIFKSISFNICFGCSKEPSQ